MKKSFKWRLKIIRGRIRRFWGWCPYCNSDTSELYDCPVCLYKKAPKRTWWKRFVAHMIILEK